ncbi:MAG: hypothetical protein EZS28_039104, partial [Streblomastix strix]
MTLRSQESGSQQEFEALKLMRKQLEQIVDKVEIEKFTIHKYALLTLIPTLFELLLYYQFTDPLYPSQTSHNVIATIKPIGAVQRRIFIAGHADNHIGLTFVASSFEIMQRYFVHNSANNESIGQVHHIILMDTCHDRNRATGTRRRDRNVSSIRAAADVTGYREATT